MLAVSTWEANIRGTSIIQFGGTQLESEVEQQGW